MKKLFANLWKSPASSFAGALVALGLWLASDAVDVPEYVALPAAGIAVFLGALYPGSNPNQ